MLDNKLDSGNKNISLHFLTLANKYLILVQNILNESIKSKNEWNITGGGDYHELTKWSDFNIFIPTLFNFYHGVELLMKGLIFIETLKIKKDHKLSKLLKKLNDDFKGDANITSIIERYVILEKITDNNLKKFFINNNSVPDKFYDLLKYPLSKDFIEEHDFFVLKYKQAEMIPLFEKMLLDITEINNIAIKHAKERGVL